ncbi:MAG: hypothetical protein K6C69_03550 [Lachnospiraceae bacterium]|nr:hypothetical protein [Lachnospiraceae bacterium]
MLFKGKFAKKNIWLYGLGLFTVLGLCFASYSILTYGQTVIHSDTATAILLWDAIRNHHDFFPDTWIYGNGDLWILTIHLFCMIPMAITKHMPLAREMASVLLMLTAALGLVLQSRLFWKNHSWVLSVSMIFVCMMGSRGMLLYEAGYTAPILWLSLCPMLFWKGMQEAPGSDPKARRIYAILFLIFMTILMMAGIRHLVEYVVPMGIAYVLLGVISWGWREGVNDFSKIKATLGRALLLLGIPVLVGTLLYLGVCASHIMIQTDKNSLAFSESLEAIGIYILQYIHDLYGCFGYHPAARALSVYGLCNVVQLVLGTLVCFVVPVLQARRWKREEDGVKFFTLYALVHNGMIFLLFTFFDKADSRYLITSIVLSIMVSARYIYVYWMEENRFLQQSLTILFMIATGLECATLALGARGWEQQLAAKKVISTELEQRGITKAYASYWNAYNNEIYSDLKISFAALRFNDDEIFPHPWLVDQDVYLYEEGTPTALLLTQEEYEKFAKVLPEQFGTPLEYVIIDDLHTLIYDHDIIKEISCGILDGRISPCEMVISPEGGALEDGVLSLVEGGYSASGIITLEKGKYVLEIAGESIDDCELSIFYDGDQASYTLTECERTDTFVSYELSVKKELKYCKIVLLNHGTDTAVIQYVKVNTRNNHE